MSQHDFDITSLDVVSGTQAMAAINAALQALASNNGGASEPVVTYPGMWWADITSGYLKLRSADNLSWVSVTKLTESLTDIKPDAVSTSLTMNTAGLSSGTLSFTAKITKIKDVVTIYLPNITGNSNSTSFVISSLPAEYRPSATVLLPILVQDNAGAYAWGTAGIGNVSTISFAKAPGTSWSTWTASGTKSVLATSLTYRI